MFESLSKNTIVTDEFKHLRRQFKNPYGSPRVVNALIEEIIDQANVLLLTSGEPTGEFLYMLRVAVDDVCHKVEVKGVALTRLISIDVLPSGQAPGGVVFLLKALSEDGAFLLRAMEEFRTPESKAPLPVAVDAGKPPMKITRIVEI